MNTGKRFEADFKASTPKDAWLYRLNDSPAAYHLDKASDTNVQLSGTTWTGC